MSQILPFQFCAWSTPERRKEGRRNLWNFPAPSHFFVILKDRRHLFLFRRKCFPNCLFRFLFPINFDWFYCTKAAHFCLFCTCKLTEILFHFWKIIFFAQFAEFNEIGGGNLVINLIGGKPTQRSKDHRENWVLIIEKWAKQILNRRIWEWVNCEQLFAYQKGHPHSFPFFKWVIVLWRKMIYLLIPFNFNIFALCF